MWKSIEVMKMVRCGDLNYLCCITADQLLDLRDGLRGMPDDEVKLIHSMVCGCAVPASNGGATPGTPGGQASADKCQQDFVNTMCSQNVQTTIALLDEAIGIIAVIGGLSGKIPGKVVKALLALSAGLSVWRLACENKQIDVGALHTICSVYDTAKSAVRLLPGDTDATLVNALVKFFSMEEITNTINKCCNSAPIATASDPPWIDDPLTYIKTNANAQGAPDWWAQSANIVLV